MKYMGSKNRHAKQILPIILESRKTDQTYVEPFVGGFNLIDKVSGPRIANDTHYHLISMFRALKAGWVPPTSVTEEEYDQIKLNQGDYDPCLVGFVGFACSYGGKWWGGYARGRNSKGEWRNYADETQRNLMRQVPALMEIAICNVSYEKLYIPSSSIIYCDPPYENTTSYKGSKSEDSFNHEHFWEWCRQLHYNDHTIFVSEYKAPADFKCVWQKEVNQTISKTEDGTYTKATEKLFTIK